MDQAYGIFLYILSLLTVGGIYALLCLGLNLQWGFAGLFNAGIAGFVVIGAYVTAICTTPPSSRHLGGFDLPIPLGITAAMLISALVAWMVSRVSVRLKSDYLAIATLGIAEILRLIMKNETWATNGARGIAQLPKPFETLPEPFNQLAMLTLVLILVWILYRQLEKAWISPWGRVMVAVRENASGAAAIGKDIAKLRINAFIIGAAIMGLGGALLAHYLKFIDPQAADPVTATFLVWVMLIVGGSANNRGAILGAMLVWMIWSASELLSSLLPTELAIRSAYFRIFLIGLALQIVLQRYTGGILQEKRLQSADL